MKRFGYIILLFFASLNMFGQTNKSLLPKYGKIDSLQLFLYQSSSGCFSQSVCIIRYRFYKNYGDIAFINSAGIIKKKKLNIINVRNNCF